MKKLNPEVVDILNEKDPGLQGCVVHEIVFSKGRERAQHAEAITVPVRDKCRDV